MLILQSPTVVLKPLLPHPLVTLSYEPPRGSGPSDAAVLGIELGYLLCNILSPQLLFFFLLLDLCGCSSPFVAYLQQIGSNTSRFYINNK